MKNNPKSSNPSSREINPKLKQHLLQHKKAQHSVMQFIEGLRSGDRMMLAQAITLVESNHPKQKEQAQAILNEVRAVGGKESFRIGITGSPGVGKSTFIEALGMSFIKDGHKVAVLSIDPSSNITKGSILGDKTRMTELSAHPAAYIRPSPSAGNLGGVARNTRETIELCEAAGYDRILIETVGVGQSETSVYYMSDFFLLLLMPGGGDDLQGIKRGIVEMADLLVINKADGERVSLAQEAQRDYQTALRLLPPKADGWQAKVMTCSALQQQGISDISQLLSLYCQNKKLIRGRRLHQNKYWFYEAIEGGLRARFFQNPVIKQALLEKENAVAAGTLSPFQAAEALLNLFSAL